MSPEMFVTCIVSEIWFGAIILSVIYNDVALISPTTSNAYDGVVVPIPTLVWLISSSVSLPVYRGNKLPSL